MTLQGAAIWQASVKFGDGKTLPFCPCKRGYRPMVEGEQKVACSFHEAARRKRLASENGKLREGEADPCLLFWSNPSEEKEIETVSNNKEDPVGTLMDVPCKHPKR